MTTDAASYMKSMCNLLKQEYAKLYHVTCIAHALHRFHRKLGKTCQKQISFKHKKSSEKRKNIYYEITKLKFSQNPVLTKYGTLIN